MNTIKKILSGAVVMAGVMQFSVPSFANPDEGLYSPLPPEGSAFIRFINDQVQQGSEAAKANGKIYDYVDYKEVSSYFVVDKGSVDAVIGDGSKTFQAEPGKFYTAVLQDSSEVIVNEDKLSDNRAKAQISFYNLTGQDDLSVKTTDGKVDVVPPTPAQQTGNREINPVKVSLGVFKGDKMLKDLGSVSLDRTNNYSIVAYSESDIEWVQSTTNTTR